MMPSGKDIALISGPQEHDTRPVPPVYASPYPVERLRALSYDPDPDRHYGPVTVQAISYHDALRIVTDFDLALSQARFELWQCRGMSKP